MEYPLVLLERNLYVHHLAGLLLERKFEKARLEHGWEQFFKLEMFLVNQAC